MARPADYPPPFRSSEFITEPSDPVDERIEVGVLVVGAGPAGLAVTPDGSTVYVANSGDYTVSVIATASNTVNPTFTVGIRPLERDPFKPKHILS